MSQNVFNPWDRDYGNNQIGPVYVPLWEILNSFLQSYFIKTVLDFGCGDGNYAFLIGRKGIHVTGIDISVKAINKAKRYKKIYGDEKCDFFCGNSIPDGLPDCSFDSILMLNSYHCLNYEERSNVMVQANRILKPEGFFFASVLALEDESYPRKNWREIEDNTFDNGEGKVFHFFSSDELSTELKEFEILDHKMLQNIHPDIRRKSALHVIAAKRDKKNHK